MPNRTISLKPINGPASIRAINCGSSSPRLGGTLDVSAFPNLTSIRCVSNGITKFQGYGPLTELVTINLADNAFGADQGNFETLSNKPNLREVSMQAQVPAQYNNWTGTFPDFSSNLNLEIIRINNSSLTGNNLDLSMLTKLRIVSIQFNLLQGSFPLLPKGANSQITQIHFGQSRNIRYTNTTAPDLVNDFPRCTNLVYSGNDVTGNIQSIPARMTNFWCDGNRHTGTIPSLAAAGPRLVQCSFYGQREFNGVTGLTGNIPDLSTNTALTMFRCDTNRITGFDGGSVSNTLGEFQAQNNLLTSNTVNAILAAFVAAGRTTGTRILNLGGTGNAAPTGQGLTDKATLISRGWTVTTN